MHDLHSCVTSPGERFSDVVDEDRDVGVDRRGCVGGHDAELVPVVVSQSHDPPVIHEDAHPENRRMLGNGLVEVRDGEIGNHSINVHAPTLSPTAWPDGQGCRQRRS
ncbi:Uncharacterised protein [Mycobacteroides abscessus subsp. abscessus]|nr:Uncharacterised protein [Mycobacteroides abscessus subsp. abscessus]